MYSERQKQILGEITRGLGLPEPKPDAVAVQQCIAERLGGLLRYYA
jgi:hypothetical protein